jgi:hypothetical protein
MENYHPDNEVPLRPISVAAFGHDGLAVPSPLAGVASDQTKLFLEVSPNPIVYNNAVISEQFVTAIFVYQGLVTPGMTVSQCYSFSVSLRAHGSFDQFYNNALLINSVDLDETTIGSVRLRVVFKVNMVTSKLKGKPFVLAMVMRPRYDAYGLASQVAETGDICVKSQVPKAAAISRVEKRLLEREWIDCRCSPCACATRFCPMCGVSEYNAHLTDCLFHTILLKQDRLEKGPPAKKARTKKNQ